MSCIADGRFERRVPEVTDGAALAGALRPNSPASAALSRQTPSTASRLVTDTRRRLDRTQETAATKQPLQQGRCFAGPMGAWFASAKCPIQDHNAQAGAVAGKSHRLRAGRKLTLKLAPSPIRTR
jgi:hypothetical protein